MPKAGVAAGAPKAGVLAGVGVPNGAGVAVPPKLDPNAEPPPKAGAGAADAAGVPNADVAPNPVCNDRNTPRTWCLTIQLYQTSGRTVW